MPPKQMIYEQCRQMVAGKLDALQHKLRDLAESAANETKSSAGDKYETGRAMLHIEQDNVRKQISELMAQQAVLDAIDPASHMGRIGLGSVVKAGSVYFLSIALGKMQIGGETVIALSLQSPLGARLKGLAVGDSLVMNDKELVIEEVM
jgi:transcription elongation GreA/GreB family factor